MLLDHYRIHLKRLAKIIQIM